MDILEGYDQWLQRPYDYHEPDDAQNHYETYLKEFREESDREFYAGGHDFVDPDEFYLAGDKPDSFSEFIERWMDDQEEEAVYRRAEERYERV